MTVKNIPISTPVVVSAGIVLAALAGYALFAMSGTSRPVVTMSADDVAIAEDFLAVHPALAAMEMADVSDTERASLVRMREEEKLAHDVYVTLGDVWNLRIFTNIAASEQTHTDAITTLLDRYGITDPVTDLSVGAFVDPTMAALYADLTAKGRTSLAAALTVGATVEDMDIADLQVAVAAVDNKDILYVYDNLMRGSRNHLRAFARQLDAAGASYDAQYLSQDAVDTILAGTVERGDDAMAASNGRGDRRGAGPGNGGGRNR